MKSWLKSRLTESKGSVEAAGEVEMAEPSPAADEPRWLGFIDVVDRLVITGWCCDRANPMASLAVEAVGSQGSHAVAIACLFRRDVKDSGYGTGYYGFELDLAAFHDSETVTVRFVESRAPITSAPIALDPIDAVCTNPLPVRFSEAARQAVRAVEVRHLARDASRASSSPQDEPYDDRLLATFDPTSDPEALITRFTAQEVARIERDAFDLEMTGTLQERLGVLLWYVDLYAASRPIWARVPLGAGQIAALNAPAPIGGASAAATVALHNFVLRHLSDHADLRDERVLLEAVYWWCVEQAPLHRLEDRLVTAEQVDLLSAYERGAGTEFPCTAFMVLYAARHPDLQDLDLGLPRDRLALLAYLVLASVLDPGLVRFLPRETLRRLTRKDTSGRSELGSILARFSGADGHAASREAGQEIVRKAEDLLAVSGRSIAARRGGTPTSSPKQTPREGVAVIGPLSKSSGLGRAMRLSTEALAAAEAVAPALYDFGIENPAPGGGGLPSGRFGPLDAPREITLMHLNAEALPLALAYGPRHCLAGSYRIGFFYWELNEIPECQRLALDLVDEVWVASEFNRAIYARATDKPVIRVGVAAPALPEVAAASRDDYGIDSGAFVFVAVFDSLSFIARKNPLGTIEAFRRAFPIGDEPVQLVLKTQNRGIVQDAWQLRMWRRIDRAVAADPRILVVGATLAFPELVALMRSCDAYVSLHRAEGWGFGLVEAMQLGLPVICTGYSGNADFCTSETTFLIEHGLIPVALDEYIYVPRGSVWADPSIASAAARMRHVVADRDDARRKADAAKHFVDTQLNLKAVAELYAARLAAIRGGIGNGKASE